MRVILIVALVVIVGVSLSWYSSSASSHSLIDFAATAYKSIIDRQISLVIDISNTLPPGSAYDIPEGKQPLTLTMRIRNSSHLESKDLRFALRFSEAVVDYLEVSAGGIVVSVDTVPPVSEWQSFEVYFIPQFNGDPEATQQVAQLLGSPIMVQAMVHNKVDHLLVTPTVNLELPVVSDAVDVNIDPVLGWVGDRVLVSVDNPQGLELELRGPDGTSEPLGVEALPTPLSTPIWDNERRFLAYSALGNTVVVVDVVNVTSQIISFAGNPTWTPLGLQVTYESVGRVIRFD